MSKPLLGLVDLAEQDLAGRPATSPAPTMSPSGALAGRSRRSPDVGVPDEGALAAGRVGRRERDDGRRAPGRTRAPGCCVPGAVPQLGAGLAAHGVDRQDAVLEAGRAMGRREGGEGAVGAEGHRGRGRPPSDGRVWRSPTRPSSPDDADPDREPVVRGGDEHDPAAVPAERDLLRCVRRELGAEVDRVAAPSDGISDPVADLVAARVRQPGDPPPVGREPPDACGRPDRR